MIKNLLFLFSLVILLPVNISSQSIRTIDRDILESINNMNGPFINGFCDVSSASASVFSIGVPIGLLVYSFIEKNPSLTEKSLYVGASVSISFLSSWILKDVFDRNRPYKTHPALIKNDEIENSYSFPSSHAAVSFGLATALSLQFPKWYIIAPSYFWATSVGFSRIQKGVHYPSDVIAGALLGSGSAIICYELNKWINEKSKNTDKPIDTSWLTHVF